MSFNSSHATINGHAINTVLGSQCNHTQTITAEVVHMNDLKMDVGRTDYDEFEYVQRGRIVTTRKIYTEDLSERRSDWKNGELVWRPLRSARRTICTAEVHPHRQSKYTMVIYEGEDAHISWGDDFERFSRAGLWSVRLQASIHNAFADAIPGTQTCGSSMA